ncbi:hypothetical protein ACQPZG_22825 [Streptomyces sp. CA-294286]|uniref:hypothetical protein n=1 Tax=Streptomyces sp. CA-294286 TaxID=3240070 RepID=UPI003D8C2B19
MPDPSHPSSPRTHEPSQELHGSPSRQGSHASHMHQETHAPQGHRGPAEPPSTSGPGSGSAGDVVRWAAFSCLLVPGVLIGYGGSPGSAAVAAAGLAAVTVVCRLLLRRSERAAARDLPEELQGGVHRGRHSRTGSGTHRGGRRADP